MSGGSSSSLSEIPSVARDVLEHARRAVLATADRSGAPHAVPVVYALHEGMVITPVDHKPKSGRRLARLRNIEAEPRVALTVDVWDEDWDRLAWVMIRGEAHERPADETAVAALTARYPQYNDGEVDALIAVVPDRILWWSSAPS